ncbi:hypothetical protein [Halorubrum ezzemoulense]|uniref:hypothetical protein n=1 Tax=Halorubrum ezzemoulense TaxID=337243 RepID=UPI00232F529A|nr:hypothetical protein [Halorubrum ezzemoulense]MDB9233849.1 hypothetical protein [Halorubrum ezzemoulense]
MLKQRRGEFVGTLAVALAPGCISGDEPQVSIHEIDVVNLRDESVEVTITAERGDEIVYEDSFEFDPKQGGSTDGVYLKENWMGGQGDLEVTVSADSLDEASLSTASLAREYEDAECLSVFTPIDENGVSMYYAEIEC